MGGPTTTDLFSARDDSLTFFLPVMLLLLPVLVYYLYSTMMEFGFNGQIMETFTPLGLANQQKEDGLMWLVKTEVLPWAYWNLMTKGFVPWSEAKNMMKKVTAKLQQRGERAASA